MKSTPIEIDKYRNLRYDFNAMSDIESITKLPLSSLIRPLAEGSFEATRAVLWAGLKWEDPNLTIREAGDFAQLWIEKSGSNIGGLVEVLVNALVNAGWLEQDEDITGSGQGESSEASNN